MKKIGITGSIACGKTTLCKKIEALGYDVFYSDDVANELVEKDNSVKYLIKETFGEEAYIDGVYNRKHIAKIVFNDVIKLNTLSSIFKHFIEEAFIDFCKDKEVVFYESALIYEAGIEDKFDFIVAVYASEETISKRLKIRNGFDDEEIRERLDNQFSPEYKVLKSDFFINSEIHNLDDKIEQLLKILNERN